MTCSTSMNTKGKSLRCNSHIKQPNSIKDDMLLIKTTKNISPLSILDCKIEAGNRGNKFHQTEVTEPT